MCILRTPLQWASFSQKLQKLIILDPVHMFLFPIQDKGKIARGIRIWTENLNIGFLTLIFEDMMAQSRHFVQKFTMN